MLVCYAGVNDLDRRVPLCDVIRNVSNIAAACAEREVTFVYVSIICSTYQHSAGAARIRAIRCVNAQIHATLRQAHQYFCDVSDCFAASHFRPDGLHLNRLGNAHLMALLGRYLARQPR